MYLSKYICIYMYIYINEHMSVSLCFSLREESDYACTDAAAACLLGISSTDVHICVSATLTLHDKVSRRMLSTTALTGLSCTGTCDLLARIMRWSFILQAKED